MRRILTVVWLAALAAGGGPVQASEYATLPAEGSAPAESSARADTSAPAKRALVIHIRVEGMIDGGQAAFIERAIAAAEEQDADALLIELNTYGGRVEAADDIRSALLETELFTITFVHNNAASAGALIAIATDSIAMAPGSAIGAATPVNQSGTPAGSKVISYFRGLMGETARAKGRDPRVAEAMVDSGVVVPGMESAPRPLTLRTDQALEVGIVQQEAKNVEEVLRLNGLEGAEVQVLTLNWGELVTRFLTNPLVSGLLMTIGALGLIKELTSPGFGLAGMAGVVCLTLFFGSHWIVKLAELQDMLLVIVGIVLIVIELFVPGGIVGIIGGLLVAVGLFLSLIGKIEFVTPPELGGAVTSLGLAIILTFVGALIILRSFVHMPLFRQLLLTTRQQPGRGEVRSDTPTDSMIGMEGVADSALRPAGHATIGTKRVNVVADGERIEVGSRIRVVEVDGLRGIVVRQA